MARISLRGGHVDRKCAYDACVGCFIGRRVRRKKHLGALGEIQKEAAAYWVKWDLRGGSWEKCGCADSEKWPPSVLRRYSAIQKSLQEDLYVEFFPFGAQRAGQIPAYVSQIENSRLPVRGSGRRTEGALYSRRIQSKVPIPIQGAVRDTRLLRRLLVVVFLAQGLQGFGHLSVGIGAPRQVGRKFRSAFTHGHLQHLARCYRSFGMWLCRFRQRRWCNG